MRRLEGVRVVVTRATHQAGELAGPLRRLGAEVILLPVIEIGRPVDPEPLERAARHVDDYDWIVFTSGNAVRAFVQKLSATAERVPARVAVIGEATRRVAEQAGFTVSLMAAEAVAESLVEAFGAENLQGNAVLIPSAAVTRDVLAPALRERGARVTVIEAYRNVVPAAAAQQASNIFRDNPPDWVTFASSSAVENLVGIIGAEPLQRVKIASIGPVTSATIRSYGLAVSVEANPHTIEALVAALQ